MRQSGGSETGVNGWPKETGDSEATEYSHWIASSTFYCKARSTPNRCS